MKLVVALGGASGAIYAQRLLDYLAQAQKKIDLEIGLCLSSTAKEVWNYEIGPLPTYPFTLYDRKDFHAPFASGSAGWDAMVVIPCSTGAMGRMAGGISEDLIGRAADVMLKERRKLVLVVRESPLSAIHLENMLTLTKAGAVILPAAPSFYSKPESINDLVDTVVGRALDQIGIPHDLLPRWGSSSENMETSP